MAEFTVVFADLTGSTGVFEALGNVKATRVITQLTQWIGSVCEVHGGHIVKCLGDGVLIVFRESIKAIEAASELQKIHQDRIANSPVLLKMRLQVGIARGEVIKQNGDCYGDAVNVASRLSDLSGSGQILVSDSVIRDIPAFYQLRARCLGPMLIRGRSESCVVHRVEWQDEVLSGFFTVPASLTATSTVLNGVKPIGIELTSLNLTTRFNGADFPVFLGRDADAQFVIQDPRVSRIHAMIDWRTGRFYLKDLSSYGTWVRFLNTESVVLLRRQECALLMNGEVILGASFEDFDAPTINFTLHE